LRQGLRSTVFVGMLLLAVLGSWYLTQGQPVHDAGPTPGGITQSYYMRDATLQGMDAEGRPAYTVRAAHIRHNAGDDSFELSDIRVYFGEDPQEPWTVTAPRGRVPADRDYIDLLGGVVATRNAPRQDPLAISTPEVRIFLEDRIASTDAPVDMQMGPHRVDAVGMRAYFREDRVQLQSKVHGRFVP
jgi:lipopolysaccharide export system protein LptC